MEEHPGIFEEQHKTEYCRTSGRNFELTLELAELSVVKYILCGQKK